MHEKTKKRIIICALFLLILAGGVLRMWGADWGLPTLLHPDEHTIVDPAINMAQRHSFEPDVFYRPDHLTIKINMLVYTFISRGIFHMHVEDLAAQNLALLYRISRIITAFFGMGMILMAYLLGAKIKKGIGLIAAALFAFFPSFITHSHYATPDILTAFCMMLFMYFAIEYLQNASYKNLFLMSLSVSAFFTIKYPGAILGLCVAIVIIIRGILHKKYKRMFAHGIWAIVLMLFLIFIISPTLITDLGSVIRAVTREARPAHAGADGLGWGGNLLFYVESYLSFSGILLSGFFVCGIVAFVKKAVGYQYIPLFSGIVYWLVLGYMSLHWERWAVPMYVTPLLVSAVGIYYTYSFLKSKVHFKRYSIAFTLVLCLIGANFLTCTAAEMTKFLTPDTRVVSKEYCEKNGFEKANTTYEGYTPLRPTSPAKLPDLDQIAGAQNIILSSSMYSRFKAEPERYQSQMEKYQYIEDHFTLVKRYTPPDRKTSVLGPVNIFGSIKYVSDVTRTGFVGPEILIYVR